MFGLVSMLAVGWLPFVMMSRGELVSGWSSIDDRMWKVTFAQRALRDHIHVGQAGPLQFGGPSNRLPNEMVAALMIDLPPREESPYLRSYEVVRGGWPWRSFRATRSFDLTTTDPLAELWTHGAILKDGSVLEPLSMQVLPYGPMWSGLLANVAVWSAGWCVLLFGLSTMRSLVRRRRGRCPRCGYDLAHSPSDACPECGTKV